MIGEADLERELTRLRQVAAGPTAGLFGPGSMRWRIDREAALFLGAGRALLLQLAHPWVAVGIAEHSRTLADPIGRFHRTFRVVYAFVFGSLDQAMAAAWALHRMHARIQGLMPLTAGPFPKGTPYHANDIAALRWVFATLVETTLLVHDLILPPLSPAERERYYAESRQYAACFGIPKAALPETWSAFLVDTDATIRSVLSITPQAKNLADRLLPRTGWLRIPSVYRALTAQLLPAHLCVGFGLPARPADRQAAIRALRWFKRTYPLLPPRLRYVGPYHEATARVAGREYPDLAARLSNRFWIGQPRL